MTDQTLDQDIAILLRWPDTYIVPHVGLIYGDSITLERAEAILKGLKAKGFASSNIVFGVGSYTYQHCTRDTFGFAVKSTYGIVNGEGREIFKDPVTDSGVKKSARGALEVRRIGKGDYYLQDRISYANLNDVMLEHELCELKVVFRDGSYKNRTSIEKIRKRLRDK